MSCVRIVSVGSDAELDSALAKASDGTCLDLTPGSYHAVDVPSGVHLLGRSAECVQIESVDVVPRNDGRTSRVRGLTVRGGGVRARAGAEATVEHVRIVDSMEDAFLVDPGAYMTLSNSEISGAARYGVSAFGAGVTLKRVHIHDGEGPGVWAACDVYPAEEDGCHCSTPPPQVMLEDVTIERMKTIGMVLDGVRAGLDSVRIHDTQVGANFQNGGGLATFGCSDVRASHLHLIGNVDYGMLVADATLSMQGLVSRANLRGLVVQTTTMPTTHTTVVESGVLEDNLGVGVMIDANTDVALRDTVIRSTVAKSVPVVVGGVSASQQDVGHGVVWCGPARAELSNIELSGNELGSVVIERAVAPGSRLDHITLRDGDESKGIIARVAPGGTVPAVGSDVPDLDVRNEPPEFCLAPLKP